MVPGDQLAVAGVTQSELVSAFAIYCGIREGFFYRPKDGSDPMANLLKMRALEKSPLDAVIEDEIKTLALKITIPQRMANPLDLRSWRDRNNRPYPEINGYAQFPVCQIAGCKNPDHPCELGWSAGRTQCQINIVKRGLTFYEFFAGKPGVYAGFAPSKDKNEPAPYAQFVCDGVCTKLGVDSRCGRPGCKNCTGVDHPRCINNIVANLIMEK